MQSSNRMSLPGDLKEVDFFTSSFLIDDGYICGWKKISEEFLLRVYREENYEVLCEYRNSDFGEPILLRDGIIYVRSKGADIYVIDFSDEQSEAVAVKKIEKRMLIQDLGQGRDVLLKLVGSNRRDQSIAYADLYSMKAYWRRKQPVYSSRIDGSKVYVVSGNGLEALDLRSGESIWELPIKDIKKYHDTVMGLQSELLIFENTIVLLAREHGVFFVDKESGQILHYQSGLETRYADISSEGILYIADRSNILSISTKTADLLETIQLPPVPSIKNDFRKVSGIKVSETHIWIGYADSGDYGGELMAVSLESGDVEYLEQFPGLVDRLFIRSNRLYFQVMGFGSIEGGPNLKNYVMEGTGGYSLEQ